MTIKEAAAKTGLTEKTIRYYESAGLIFPSMQNKNGRKFRSYSTVEIEKLKQISILRKMNFSVEEIKNLYQKPELFQRICEDYRKRMEEQRVKLEHICILSNDISWNEIKGPKELCRQAERYAKKLSLPDEDYALKFKKLDIEEENRKPLKHIHVWKKKSLLPIRLNYVEAAILLYVIPEKRSFTDICHFCMKNGITTDLNRIKKIVNRMRRKGVLTEKSNVFRALVGKNEFSTRDVERLVQTAATGSPDFIFVYNWNPPGGVSSMPYTGL